MNIPFERFRDGACKHFEHEPGLFDPICTFPLEDAGYQYNEEDVPCNEENCPFMKDNGAK